MPQNQSPSRAKHTRLNDIYELLGIKADTPFEELTPDQLVDVYIEVDKERRAAEQLQKLMGQHRERMEPLVLSHFEQHGQQSVSRRGVTVYLTREEYPKVLDADLVAELGPDPTEEQLEEAYARARQRVVVALRQSPDTAHLVKQDYNHQTLRSFILKDCPEDPETLERVLPEHLQGILGVSTIPRAKVRSA